jgi:hypothetical protein
MSAFNDAVLAWLDMTLCSLRRSRRSVFKPIMNGHDSSGPWNGHAKR